jgi:nucleotide-binding universal stress UspA family protein
MGLELAGSSEKILERSETALRQDGIECETRSAEGDPADVLVRLAAECGADLLVIGNKGDEASPARQRPEHSHAQGRLHGDGRQDHLSEPPGCRISCLGREAALCMKAALRE